MMNFELRAVSPEEYDQFLAAKEDGTSRRRRRSPRSGRSRSPTTTAPFATKRDAQTRNDGAVVSAEAEAPP